MQGRGPLLPTDEQYQKMEEEFGNAVTEKAEEEAYRQAQAAFESNRLAAATGKTEESGNWFTRLMGFEKYPNETDDEWQSRVYYMSIK